MGIDHWLRIAGSTASMAASLALAQTAPATDPKPTVTLVLPEFAATARCAVGAAPLDALDRKTVTLASSFIDNFDSLDFARRRWMPIYDGGYDPVNDRWLGYDWGLTKRTLQGNKEQQVYVDAAFTGTGARPLGIDPFVVTRTTVGNVSSSVLSIEAARIPPSLRPLLYNYEYSSGVIQSRPSFVQRYGFYEMRARIPSGKALWPAFWLLAADRRWPPEIDILEVVGQSSDVMVTTTHATGADGVRVSSGCRTTLPDAARDFHQFGMLWMPDRIVWYIDRTPVAQIVTPPGMNVPMYMVLNLAVGGVMVGAADATTPMPSRFDIDWVAAYQLKGHPPCEPRKAGLDIDACAPIASAVPAPPKSAATSFQAASAAAPR